MLETAGRGAGRNHVGDCVCVLLGLVWFVCECVPGVHICLRVGDAYWNRIGDDVLVQYSTGGLRKIPRVNGPRYKIRLRVSDFLDGTPPQLH